MSKRNNRANATDVNKTPLEVRYVFIVDLVKASGYRGFNIMTTHHSLDEARWSQPKAIKVVDLRNNLVNSFRVELLDDFLDQWRENYFDYDWEIPFQFFS